MNLDLYNQASGEVQRRIYDFNQGRFEVEKDVYALIYTVADLREALDWVMNAVTRIHGDGMFATQLQYEVIVPVYSEQLRQIIVNNGGEYLRRKDE